RSIPARASHGGGGESKAQRVIVGKAQRELGSSERRVLEDVTIDRDRTRLSRQRQLEEAAAIPVVATTGGVIEEGALVGVPERHVEPRRRGQLLDILDAATSAALSVGDLAVRHGHQRVVLNLAVVRRGESPQYQAIGPWPVHDAERQAAAQAAVSIVEAPHRGRREASRLIEHLDVDRVVVLRGIQKAAQLSEEAAASVEVPQTEGKAMGVERAKLVGEAAPGLSRILIRDQMHRAAERVGAKPRRHDPLIYLDAVDQADRDVGDPERVPRVLEGDTVEKKPDAIPGQASQRVAARGAKSAGALYPEARGAGEHIA